MANFDRNNFKNQQSKVIGKKRKMDIKAEYYLSKYEKLKVLSDTEKCKTMLMRNIDTGELAIQKEMGLPAYKIYNELKQIDNKNLVHVIDCFQLEDKCITIEEYVNGKRMENIIGEEGISIKDTIDYGLQLCNALSEIHKKGIIHRDIQPKNIIITSEGLLKLIDFDIAREEKENVPRDTNLFGTVGYASPEQYGFAQTDCRSDIYSVGVLLKEMALGKRDRDNSIILQKLSKENSVNHTIISGSKFIDIINKCMQIDADNRYPCAEHLQLALNACKGTKIVDNCFGKRDEIVNKPKKKEETVDINILPELTLKNVIFSIPGFKKKNPIFAIFALLIYAMVTYVFVEMGLEVPVTGVKKIYSIVMYTAFFVIPYLYFTNIGQIVQRFPKRKFRSKAEIIVFQILYGCILFFAIGCIIAFTLPSLNTK